MNGGILAEAEVAVITSTGTNTIRYLTLRCVRAFFDFSAIISSVSLLHTAYTARRPEVPCLLEPGVDWRCNKG